MMSIKGTRITNGFGDGGCGDEKDTKMLKMAILMMIMI